MKKILSSFSLALAGLAVGLLVGVILAALAGENPVRVLAVIFKSAFGSRYDLGVTLYYTTPLIFTGLSVAMAFHSGLFNIGAEGQLNLAALAVAVVGTILPLPILPAALVSILVAILVGGFWAWIPGWLKTRRGSHEVINTIMMNFVSAALVSWLVTKFFQNANAQSPETAHVLPGFHWRSWDPVAKFFGDAPVSAALPIAVLVAILLWVFLWKTRKGFEIRAVGENEIAAGIAGIDVAKARQWAMALAGALAGMVAIAEILGNAGRFRMGFSPDFGFVGIAVALLARNNPIGILFSAFLFGALHKGAADLDIETEYVTRDLSLVIQALVILFVAIFSSLKARGRR